MDIFFENLKAENHSNGLSIVEPSDAFAGVVTDTHADRYTGQTTVTVGMHARRGLIAKKCVICVSSKPLANSGQATHHQAH